MGGGCHKWWSWVDRDRVHHSYSGLLQAAAKQDQGADAIGAQVGHPCTANAEENKNVSWAFIYACGVYLEPIYVICWDFLGFYKISL